MTEPATGGANSVRLYMQAILDRPGDGIFGKFKRLLQPASWRMEDNYDPLNSDSI